MSAEYASLSRLVLWLAQHSKLPEPSVFAHRIAEVCGPRTATVRSGEPNVRSELGHEAPHAAQCPKPPGTFDQSCSAIRAEQPDGLGRPVERYERRHRPPAYDDGIYCDPVSVPPWRRDPAELHHCVCHACQEQ